MALILFLAILLSIALFLYNKERRPKNFPPGPVGLPIVGYLPFLGPESYADIGKIGKKYGDIFSMKMGSYWYVVLNDFDIIKNALKDEVFTGRPNYLLRMSFYKKGQCGDGHCGDGRPQIVEYSDPFRQIVGITFNNGANWQAQRRFSMKVLRDFGFGKMSMISSIQDEIKELQEFLRENTEKPIDLSEVLPISILNSLWNILTGEKFSLSDSLPKKIHSAIKYGLSGQDVLGILYFLPWLAKLIPGKTSGTDKMKAAVGTLQSVLKATIDEHRQRFVPGSSLKDYIDAYLQQIEECEDPRSSFYDEEGVLNLIDGLTNFCVPGTDSISSSMSFALLYIASSRDVMKKIHAEIDTVIGRERLPDAADRPNMPYMSAVVNETFRLSSIIPGDVPHSTTAATELGGYTLPKGTIIIPNIYQVHHDEKYWGDPEVFRPERFLNSDGMLRKEERVIPFSIGKRVCVAEGLAQVQFFLFLTGVLQHFDYLESPDHPLPGFKPKSTFSLSPHPYKLVVRERA